MDEAKMVKGMTNDNGSIEDSTGSEIQSSKNQKNYKTKEKNQKNYNMSQNHNGSQEDTSGCKSEYDSGTIIIRITSMNVSIVLVA